MLTFNAFSPPPPLPPPLSACLLRFNWLTCWLLLLGGHGWWDANPPQAAAATRGGCLDPLQPPPCEGAAGGCVQNRDGSQGGFVARTARLEPACWRNGYHQPYIGVQAQVCDFARISGNAELRGCTRVVQRAFICGPVQLSQNASVSGQARLAGAIKLAGNAAVSGYAFLRGPDIKLSGQTHISGHTRWKGPLHLTGTQQITHTSDLLKLSTASSGRRGWTTPGLLACYRFLGQCLEPFLGCPHQPEDAEPLRETGPESSDETASETSSDGALFTSSFFLLGAAYSPSHSDADP